MRLTFIDHYDSFSWNILAWLRSAGFEVSYFLCDQNELSTSLPAGQPIVLSPGPGVPERYKATQGVVRKFLHQVPILGICLGHQILGVEAGFKLQASDCVWHGSQRDIFVHSHTGLFKGAADSIKMATYNSLCLSASESISGWEVTARNASGEIESIECWQNPQAPALGVQFHPESFLSEKQVNLAARFFQICT